MVVVVDHRPTNAGRASSSCHGHGAARGTARPYCGERVPEPCRGTSQRRDLTGRLEEGEGGEDDDDDEDEL
eukprot:102324-Pyramimonas_sp.AAC.1